MPQIQIEAQIRTEAEVVGKAGLHMGLAAGIVTPRSAGSITPIRPKQTLVVKDMIVNKGGS